MKIICAIGLVIVATLCYLNTAAAEDLFYSGDIVIESVGVNVEVNDEGIVKAVYLLRNKGDREEKISLSLSQSPEPLYIGNEKIENPVTFNPGEAKSFSAAYELDIGGETTKLLSLDPSLYFNGKPNSKPVGSLLIEILLPEGIPGIITANPEYDSESIEGGRKFYSWQDMDVYPTMLRVRWSTLAVYLEVIKEAEPLEITSPGQIIKVELTIQNKGQEPLKDLFLTDDYVTSHFEAVEPLEQFTTRENILFWVGKIDSLGPQATKTLTYSVKYIGFSPETYDFDLRPCAVSLDGYLVAVSNEVRLSQKGNAATAIPEQPLDEDQAPKQLPHPSIPEIGVILFVLAVGGGIGYLVRKRRKAT